MSKAEFLKDPEAPIEPCPNCDGDGYFEVVTPQENHVIGTQEIFEEIECPNCNGKGIYETL